VPVGGIDSVKTPRCGGLGVFNSAQTPGLPQPVQVAIIKTATRRAPVPAPGRDPLGVAPFTICPSTRSIVAWIVATTGTPPFEMLP
jgi:hypothetical protein